MPGRSLILNATYEPICVSSSRRALVLILDEKAELVHETGRAFHSERASFPEPSIVRLVQFVKIPRQTRIAISRRSVFARDGHRCQYCGAQAENIDHVVPKSRGEAPHAWDNVVAFVQALQRRERRPALGSIRFDASPPTGGPALAGLAARRKR